MFGIVCYSNYHNKALSKVFDPKRSGQFLGSRHLCMIFEYWKEIVRARGSVGTSPRSWSPENAGTRKGGGLGKGGGLAGNAQGDELSST